MNVSVAVVKNAAYKAAIDILSENENKICNDNNFAHRVAERCIFKLFPPMVDVCRCGGRLSIRSSRLRADGTTRYYLQCKKCGKKKISTVAQEG